MLTEPSHRSPIADERRKRWGGKKPLSWLVLQLCVLYCGGSWCHACVRGLWQVLVVVLSPGGTFDFQLFKCANLLASPAIELSP